MKAILMSIRPQHVANILNGLKTIEIRKKFPKDYVGWVYIYCTKNGDYLMKKASGNGYITCMRNIQPKQTKYSKSVLNGKVVARFWCDKVEKINAYSILDTLYETKNVKEKELLKASCLTYQELNAYLKHKNGKAIHITKLEIFDKPKEIKEFRKPNTFSLEQLREFGLPYNEEMYKDMATKGKWFLTRAPQSFMFIEIE